MITRRQIAWVTRSPYGPAEHLLRVAKREERDARQAADSRAAGLAGPLEVAR